MIPNDVSWLPRLEMEAPRDRSEVTDFFAFEIMPPASFDLLQGEIRPLP